MARTSSHNIHPAPPLQPTPSRTFANPGIPQPQQPFPNEGFLQRKDDRNGFAIQEEEIQRMNRKITQQAERMYGPSPQITQGQYDEAVKVVERMEMEERMRQHEAQNSTHSGRRPEWLGARPHDGE